MTHQTQHITICGGGYAGTMALGRLRMLLPDARLTLIDPRSHFEHRIQMHEVAAGTTLSKIHYDELCATWGAEHVQQRVLALEGRTLTLEHGTLEPDAVLLTLGSRVQAPPGPCHTVDDEASASALAAALAVLPAGAAVTVIGAGLTGLEVVTALALAHPALRFTLWRAGKGWERCDSANGVLDRRLRGLGIEVFDGGRVTTIDDDRCTGPRGSLVHQLAIWCGGFEPNALHGLGSRHPDGRLRVDDALQLAPGVFAAGDLACPPALHRLGCVTALPTGAHAATNVAHWLRGEPLEPFRFRDVFTCVALGGRHGLVEQLARDGTAVRAVGGLVGGATKRTILGWVAGILRLERATGLPLYGWAT